jgi:hypothetical protein
MGEARQPISCSATAQKLDAKTSLDYLQAQPEMKEAVNPNLIV